jgi:hypothetical protein
MAFGLTLVLMLTSMAIAPVDAARSTTNRAGAIKVQWHLSGEVMPVPPYGSLDIPGSDVASKLIVNQPNGYTQVTLTGAMNGLAPNTEYTVYISNVYTPAVFTGWDVSGAWVMTAVGTYSHNYALTMTVSNGVITGSGTYPAGGPASIYETVTGTVVDTAVTLHIVYYFDAAHTLPTGYTANAALTIQPDGSLVGTFIDSSAYTGSFVSTSGHATKTYSGSMGWPDLVLPMVPAFTFTTNGMGEGSWHLNLNAANLNGYAGTLPMSVWINGGGATILISDSFNVVVH